jgi:hypothetical protein
MGQGSFPPFSDFRSNGDGGNDFHSSHMHRLTRIAHAKD